MCKFFCWSTTDFTVIDDHEINPLLLLYVSRVMMWAASKTFLVDLFMIFSNILVSSQSSQVSGYTFLYAVLLRLMFGGILHRFCVKFDAM